MIKIKFITNKLINDIVIRLLLITVFILIIIGIKFTATPNKQPNKNHIKKEAKTENQSPKLLKMFKGFGEPNFITNKERYKHLEELARKTELKRKQKEEKRRLEEQKKRRQKELEDRKARELRQKARQRTIAKNNMKQERKYVRKFMGNISAYSATEEDTGKSPGSPGYRVTASGVKVSEGQVAMDRSIPFGTKIYIEGMGNFVVCDRGGAINGSKVDVFMESPQAAREFGRQNRMVYILSWGGGE